MLHYDIHHQIPSTIRNQTSSQPSIITSSSASLSPSSLKSTTDSETQVGSIFGFGENILKPFMGLHNINRRDDPWNYKAYNLYQPIFTGGGTFEEQLKTSRFKRDASILSNSASLTPSTITQDSLDNLLGLQTYFQENQPLFHNSLINNGKPTTFSKPPPLIPQQRMSYRDIELAAAEINPLDTLKDTYEEDLKKILKNKHQQNTPINHPLNNLYNSEINFYNTNKAPKTLQSISGYDHDTQNTKNILNHNRILETSQEPIHTLYKHQTDLKNTNDCITKYHNISKEHIQNSGASYWGKLQEVLKTLNTQADISQDIKNSMPRQEIRFKAVDDPHNMFQEPLKSSNEDHNLWSGLNVPSVLHKRNSFWTELEDEEELREHHQDNFDDIEPIFNFDEDFD